MTTALTLFHRQDFRILVSDEAITQRDEAIACASLVRVVKDTSTQENAVNTLKEIKSLIDTAEKNREALKRPVIDLGRLIDKTERDYSADLKKEYARVNDLVIDYQEEQRQIAARLAAARQRDLEEEQRKLNAELQAKIEANPKIDVAAEVAKQQEMLEQKKAEFTPPSAPIVAEGQSVKQEWDYEVTNIHLLYQARGQECVELTPRRGAIKALINAGGVREIAGLKIYAITKNQVRTTPQRKALDV